MGGNAPGRKGTGIRRTRRGKPRYASDPRWRPHCLHAREAPLREDSRVQKVARYERLSSMAFCSIWSAVVTTLLLDWKPRWVTIILTISEAMSTLEFSML